MNRKWSERSERWTKPRWVALAVVFVVVGGLAVLTRPLDSGTGPTVTEPLAGSETTVAEPLPGVQIGDQQTVETSLGNWVWTRVDTLLDLGEEDDASGPPSTLPEVPLPQIDGVAEWLVRTGEDPFTHLFPHPNRFGDVTITAVAVQGRVDWSRRLDLSGDGWVERAFWRAMGCPSEPASVCPEQNPTLEIRYTANSDDLTSLLVEATVVSGDPEAVEFRDQDTGELLVRLEVTDREVSTELLLKAAEWDPFKGGGGAVVWKLHVDDGDPGWVDPPWLGIPLDGLAIAVSGEGFVLVGIENHYPSPGWESGGAGASPTIHTWGSPDGVAWEELRPSQKVEAVRGWHDLHLLADRDLLMLVLDDGGPLLPGRVWTSHTGSDWQPAQLDVRGVEKSYDALARTPSGWVLLIHGRSGVPGPKGARCEVWVLADGVKWEQVLFPSDSRKANVAQCSIADDAVGLITEHVTSVVPRESYYTYWCGGFEE